MCGASSDQTNIQQEQIQFMQQAQVEAAQAYSKNQALLDQITNAYTPILQAGPHQEGFDSEQKNALNAQAVEGTAENYAGAARAVNEQDSAEGGGDISMSTGAQEEMRQRVALATAGQESQEESQIQQADYATGAGLFRDATSAVATAAGQMDPNAYNRSFTDASTAAESTANQIASQNNSWINAAIGAAGAIGGAVVSQNPKNIFG